MIASATFTIDGNDIIETKGLVRGIIVRSPTFRGVSSAGVSDALQVIARAESAVSETTGYFRQSQRSASGKIEPPCWELWP